MMTTVSTIGQIKLWVSLGREFYRQMAFGSASCIKTQ